MLFRSPGSFVVGPESEENLFRAFAGYFDVDVSGGGVVDADALEVIVDGGAVVGVLDDLADACQNSVGEVAGLELRIQVTVLEPVVTIFTKFVVQN